MGALCSATSPTIQTSLRFSTATRAMRLFAPVMRRMIARNVERNMENFKRAVTQDCQ